MQLLLVLAIVAAVSISEYSPHQPVPDVGIRLALALLAMAAAPLFAVAASSLIAGSLRRDLARKRELLCWFSRLRGIHSVIWLVLAAIVLHQLGWVRLVRFNWRLDKVFLLDDLLIFLPIVVPLVLSWAAFYEVERCLAGSAAGDASPSLAVTRRQYVGLHVRHYLGLLLLPVLSVLAVQDLVQQVGPAIPGDLEAWLLVLPVVALLLLFPLVLRRIWRTEPLAAGELRERLLHFSKAVGFRPSELLVWRTDRLIVNAAVTGLVRPWRYVFFTDALLARFTSDEIEAVFGHEIGHVCRRHLFGRMLAITLPVALWFAFARAFPEVVQSLVEWLTASGLTWDVQAAIVGPGALTLYASTLFAYYAKLLEYDADLFAARSCDSNHRLSSSGSLRIAAVLEKLACVSSMDRRSRSWLHPTIADRSDFLNRVAVDPSLGESFEKRLCVLRRVMLASLLTAFAYLVVTSV